MDTNELIQQIDSTLEALDNLILPIGEDTTGEYAKRKANKDYFEKKLKGTLQKIKGTHDGSDANRTMLAEGSKEYLDELWSLAEAQGLSYQVQATKDLLESRLDILRTKLSFEKNQINRTIEMHQPRILNGDVEVCKNCHLIIKDEETCSSVPRSERIQQGRLDTV